MNVGFIHGVMNTDNMTISGETIDYGPCAFMEAYDPATVFSSIDHQGRYAFGNQPAIAQWNLVRLAECLLSLLAEDEDAAVAVANVSHPMPSEVAIKKIVDGLRLSWHPDHANGTADRQIRELRLKQINAAWEIIAGNRVQA